MMGAVRIGPEMPSQDRLDLIEQAILQWSYTTEHPIARVMVFCSSPLWVPRTVWVFSKINDELERWVAVGHIDVISAQILAIVNEAGFRLSPAELSCKFDSEENIDVNHGGNYFRRIRPRTGRP